jgi:hypothetical protein
MADVELKQEPLTAVTCYQMSTDAIEAYIKNNIEPILIQACEDLNVSVVVDIIDADLLSRDGVRLLMHHIQQRQFECRAFDGKNEIFQAHATRNSEEKWNDERGKSDFRLYISWEKRPGDYSGCGVVKR